MIEKINIIGFPKCGSSSLRTYLRDKYGPWVEVRSFPKISLYHPDWEIRMERLLRKENILNFIITRNPFDRLWSSYWWSRRWKGIEISFEDFINRRDAKTLPLTGDVDSDVSSGLHDPIGCCDYKKYIVKADRCKPIIIRFEDMIKLPSFPHEGDTTKIVYKGKNLIRPEMTETDRYLIENELIKRGINYDY